MLKPVCFPCRRFFRMRKSGYYFTEGMPRDGSKRPPAGKDADAHWKPYKIWCADLWECEGCGTAILAGSGLSAIAVQHEADFAEVRKQLGATQYQVNDC
jgi:hypothetical protein